MFNMQFRKITSCLPSWNQSRTGLFTMALCSTFFLSCRQDNLTIKPSDQKVRVDVTLADFVISTEDDATRASDKNATEAKINRIAFSVFDKNKKVVYSEQGVDPNDPKFGTFSFLVIPGDYTFVTVAHKASGDNDGAAEIRSLSEATITTKKMSNTYSCTQQVNVVPHLTQSFCVECGKRRTSTFQLLCTDDPPANVASCEIILNPSASYSTSYTFDPSTGLISEQQQYKNTFNVADIKAKTFKGVSLSVQCLLTAETQSIDITVNMKDADGETVKSRTFKNVEMKPHRVTQATGPFFHSTVNGSFLFDTTDDTSHVVNFQ